MHIFAVLCLAAALPVWAQNPLAGVLRQPPQISGSVRVEPAGDDKAVLHFAPSDQRSSVTFTLPPSAERWTRSKTFLFTFRSDSSITWAFTLTNAKRETATVRVHPYTGILTHAALPIRFLTSEFLNNRAFKAYALSSWANHIDMNSLRSLSISMLTNRPVTLELSKLELTLDAVEESAEITRPLVDEYGQWKPGRSPAEIQKAWKAEKLPAKLPPGYGGWKGLQRKATGFFRVEQIDGKWWFIDPDGFAFWSAGMDCVRMKDPTQTKGREALFERIPPNNDFYESNVTSRYNSFQNWRAASEARLRDWGFNTVANWSDSRLQDGAKVPYVANLSLSKEARWEGFPDVFSDDWAARVEAAAKEQCPKYKDDKYLIGYFIGNEPHWQNRNLVDRILSDQFGSHTRTYIRADRGSREELMEKLARRYFQVQVDAIRKADPNHLVLGIRWAGSAPDPVLKANDVFDVFSINIYKTEPPADQLAHIYNLVKRPILIGEFHFGAPDNGYAPSLVMVKDQQERGAAYKRYIEAAAANPAIIGAHYFQYVDQPVTGRFDGENYNIGFVSQQDIPYAPLVRAAKEAHARMYEIHSRK